jgi:hypothetical protein
MLFWTPPDTSAPFGDWKTLDITSFSPDSLSLRLPRCVAALGARERERVSEGGARLCTVVDGGAATWTGVLTLDGEWQREVKVIVAGEADRLHVRLPAGVEGVEAGGGAVNGALTLQPLHCLIPVTTAGCADDEVSACRLVDCEPFSMEVQVRVVEEEEEEEREEQDERPPCESWQAMVDGGAWRLHGPTSSSVSDTPVDMNWRPAECRLTLPETAPNTPFRWILAFGDSTMQELIALAALRLSPTALDTPALAASSDICHGAPHLRGRLIDVVINRLRLTFVFTGSPDICDAALGLVSFDSPSFRRILRRLVSTGVSAREAFGFDNRLSDSQAAQHPAERPTLLLFNSGLHDLEQGLHRVSPAFAVDPSTYTSPNGSLVRAFSAYPRRLDRILREFAPLVDSLVVRASSVPRRDFGRCRLNAHREATGGAGVHLLNEAAKGVVETLRSSTHPNVVYWDTWTLGVSSLLPPSSLFDGHHCSQVFIPDVSPPPVNPECTTMVDMLLHSPSFLPLPSHSPHPLATRHALPLSFALFALFVCFGRRLWHRVGGGGRVGVHGRRRA